MAADHRFRESTAKRAAYGLTILWVVLLALGILHPLWIAAAAVTAFAGGIWMGRLAEARASAEGNGIVLDD